MRSPRVGSFAADVPDALDADADADADAGVEDDGEPAAPDAGVAGEPGAGAEPGAGEEPGCAVGVVDVGAGDGGDGCATTTGAIRAIASVNVSAKAGRRAGARAGARARLELLTSSPASRSL